MSLPGVRGTDHIGFTVPDLDQADDFLVNVLGAVRVMSQAGFRDETGDVMAVQLGVHPRTAINRFNFYRLGFGSNFEVFEYDAADGQAPQPRNSDIGGHHIAIYVDDLDDAIAYLRERGVDVMGQPVPSQGGTAGNRWIYFRSPWGMQFELVCAPDGKAYEKDAPVLLWSTLDPGAGMERRAVRGPVSTGPTARTARGELDPPEALRREHEETLRFLAELSPADWERPSAAPGWRVQDVVAHLGASAHSLFTPAGLKLISSTKIERTNDELVDKRRQWSSWRVAAEYETWGPRVVKLASLTQRGPLAEFPMKLAEHGKYPGRLLVGGALTFDHHVHLRYDLAPALGRPAPETDDVRMAVVLTWMITSLGNEQGLRPIPGFDRPVAFEFDGPGAGTWRVDPDGSVTAGATQGAAAVIAGRSLDFPAWGTGRADWRDADLKITGDHDLATRLLDAINL